MIALYVLGGYLGVWLLSYRWQFKRMYTRYRNWQIANPTEVVTWATEYSYGFNHTERQGLSFKHWYDVTGDVYTFQWHEYPPHYSVLWPFLLLFGIGERAWFRVLQPFLQPTKVKGNKVDYARIKKIEKELGIEDD